MKSSSSKGAILGAAFLMATSAIGPGFLTQTTVFTQQLGASFGFVILTTILLDIGAQLNIWRVLAIAEMRAQDLANQLLPGVGYLLAALIVLGGLAFNIGNIAGAGLGANVISGMPVNYAAILSCLIALVIFTLKEAGPAIDLFTKVLGLLMIALTLYVAISSNPPMAEVAVKTFVPDVLDAKAIVTIVGGTVGGYISFAGAHRLLDAGISGKSHLPQVSRSAVSGIIITGIMRTILFVAALGVVSTGALIDSNNPPASVFRLAASEVGYKFFGVVMWSAAITSVVGAAYTSVSFIKTFHPLLLKHQRTLTMLLIVVSTIIFITIGRPVQVLVAAGAMNGLILPVALAIILLASNKQRLMKGYRHPVWMQFVGWIVVAVMSWLSVVLVMEWVKK